MIKYVSNGENKEYITISFIDLMTTIDLAPQSVQNLLNCLCDATTKYCQENNKRLVTVKVTLNKESKLGQYVLNDKTKFMDDDDDITYDKVINAFNISVYKDDIKMSNKLMHLFRERIEGTSEELSYINPNILNYIKENSDFKSFIAKEDGIDEKRKYLIYNDIDNSISEKSIFLEKQKKKD